MSLCPNCGLEMHPDESKRYGYAGEAHEHQTCISRLRSQLTAAQATAQAERERAEKAEGRCAKMELSVRTQPIASFPDAEKVAELTQTIADMGTLSAEASGIFYRVVADRDLLRDQLAAERERREAAEQSLAIYDVPTAYEKMREATQRADVAEAQLASRDATIARLGHTMGALADSNIALRSALSSVEHVKLPGMEFSRCPSCLSPLDLSQPHEIGCAVAAALETKETP